MSRVFVSYAHQDRAHALALTDWLAQREPSLRDDIFVDVNPQTGIAMGTRWKNELLHAVDHCEAVICLISRDWEASVECEIEFRQAESLRKRIFCARLDPEATGAKTREWQFCDLFANGAGETITLPSANGDAPVVFAADGLERLLHGLHDAGIGAGHFPWPPPDEPERMPYRGWHAMDAADAAVFFGRDQQLLRGLDVIRGLRATGVDGMFVVLGPSGVGKSSFLRAGLLPRLRRDPGHFLVCDIVRPEREALAGDHGLASAVYTVRSRVGLDSPALGDIKAACLAGDASQVRDWLREAQIQAGPSVPTLVLPIDQAEELFGADAGPQADTCLELLGALLNPKALAEMPIIAVTTIRADRYEAMQLASHLADVHIREFGELKPMPITEFKEVIIGPAMRASAAGLRIELEPALVSRLLADVTEGADGLPLLALTLSRLYLDYGSTGNLTLANYTAMGGMERIVDAEIDKILDPDPDVRSDQLETLRTAFIPWLANIDPKTDQPLRRVAQWRELPPASHDLINAMVARRLLVKDERSGETVVEVALESLFRKWAVLATWLREQSAGLMAVERLDRAVTDWEQNGCSPEWLIKGARLKAAEELAESPIFGDRVRHAAGFLQAAREDEDAEAAEEKARQEAELRTAKERRREAESYAAALHRRSQVLYRVLALTLVVALVAVVGLVYAYAKRREADERSRDALVARLFVEGQATLDGARGGTALEAIQKELAAQQIARHPDTGPLFKAMKLTGGLVKAFGVDPSSVLSADGQRVATDGPSGFQVRDTSSGEAVGPPCGDTRYRDWALSPDGRYLAAVNDVAIQVFDCDSNTPVGKEIEWKDNESPAHVAIGKGGRSVAAVATDGAVRWWDATRREVGSVPGVESLSTNPIAMSRDGRQLARAEDADRIRVWDADNGASAPQFLSTTGMAVTALAFSPDGRRLAAGGYSTDQESSPFRIWNLAAGAAVESGADELTAAIAGVAFSPSGDEVLTAGDDNVVRIWHAESGQPTGQSFNLRAQIHDMAMSRKGDRVMVVAGKTVQTLSTGAIAETLTPWWTSSDPAEQQDRLGTVGFGADGKGIEVLHDTTVHQLDASTGNEVAQIRLPDSSRKSREFVISPDTRWVALGDDNGNIQVVEVSTGRPYGTSLSRRLEVSDATKSPPLTVVEFSPDGRLLATTENDNSVRLWDWRAGREIGALPGHEYAVRDLAFSHDGERLYSLTVDSLEVWNTDTQRQIRTLPVKSDAFLKSMMVSPDDRRIAAVTDYKNQYIEQWDAASGDRVGNRIGDPDQWIFDYAYSPDGRYLASLSGTPPSLRFWDAETGGPLGDPVDTTSIGSVADVAYSRDGRVVYLASTNTTTTDGSAQSHAGLWTVLAPATWSGELCKKLAWNLYPWEWYVKISPDVGYKDICPDLPDPPAQ